jgi:antirestriction protein ArdC
VLKADKKLIAGAAAAAQKAADLVLGKTWDGGAEDNAAQPQIAGV